MDWKDKRLGWLGMGSIGFPMCHGLYQSGYKLVLPTYRQSTRGRRFSSLTPDADSKSAMIDEMVANGCYTSASQAELIEQSDVLLLSLPTSYQVEEVVTSAEGVLAHGKPGLIVIDLTSGDPMITQKLSKMLEEKGIELLDACVSGGIAGAIAQTLTIMVGGKKSTFETVKPILDTIGSPEKINYVGPSGAGDTIKCINNFLSACCVAATAEALMVAAKAGIDPKTANAIIRTSGGRSHASEHKFPDLAFPGKPFNFTVDLMLKDVNLFNQTAKAMHMPAYMGALTAQLWTVPSAEGKGDEDCLEFIKMYENWCGTKMVGIE